MVLEDDLRLTLEIGQTEFEMWPSQPRGRNKAGLNIRFSIEMNCSDP
jgi:hypothetical protein